MIAGDPKFDLLTVIPRIPWSDDVSAPSFCSVLLCPGYAILAWIIHKLPAVSAHMTQYQGLCLIGRLNVPAGSINGSLDTVTSVITPTTLHWYSLLPCNVDEFGVEQ